jgi:hypothetical protein
MLAALSIALPCRIFRSSNGIQDVSRLADGFHILGSVPGP